MTGCFTITCSRPERTWPRQATPHARTTFYSLKFLLIAALIAFAPAAFADQGKAQEESTTIRSMTSEQLEHLRDVVIPSATIQVTVPTSFSDKDKDPLSYLMSELTQYFPAEMLPLHRRFHETMLHLDGLTFGELVDVIWLIQNLPPSLLAKHHLLDTVHSYDAREPLQLEQMGQESAFIVMRPPRDAIQRHVGLYDALKEVVATGILGERGVRTAQLMLDKHQAHFHDAEAKKNALTDQMPHYSIVQLRKKKLASNFEMDEGDADAAAAPLNSPLDAETYRKAADKIAEILTRINEKLLRDNGKPYERTYSFRDSQLELVLPPRSSSEPPMRVVAFKLGQDGAFKASEVTRLRESNVGLAESASENSPILEMYTQKLLNEGLDRAVVPSRSSLSSWAEQRKSYPVLSFDGFTSKIRDPRVREIYQSDVRNGVISPTQFPASVQTDHGDVLLTNQTSGSLKPGKGVDKLRMAEKLAMESGGTISIGHGLYASLANGTVEWSGDADIAVGVLVHLEKDRIYTKAERNEAVAAALEKNIFVPLLEQAKRGEINIIEMRASSAYELGLSDNPREGREDAPYFSQLDLERGYTVDPKTKKKIYFKDALRANNFLKGKIEFANGEELSIQFMVGSSGKTELGYDTVISYQGDAFKGVPPIMRTAYYSDVDSFAVFSVLQRPTVVNTVQKGSLTPRAIRDPHYAGFTASGFKPVWPAKFAKKVHGLLLLFAQGGTGMDEIFAVKTLEILKRQQKYDPTWYEKEGGLNAYLKGVKENLRIAFNQEELAQLSGNRRRVNDLREYNERIQEMPASMFERRAVAFKGLLPRLKKLIRKLESGDVPIDASDMKKARSRFKRAMDFMGKLSKQDLPKTLLDPASRKVFKNFETQLTFLDGKLVTRALPAQDRIFLETYIRYLPFMYIDYLRTRDQVSDDDFKVELESMGIQPTSENIALLSDVTRVYDMSDKDLRKLESKLFGVSCMNVLEIGGSANEE